MQPGAAPFLGQATDCPGELGALMGFCPTRRRLARPVASGAGVADSELVKQSREGKEHFVSEDYALRIGLRAARRGVWALLAAGYGVGCSASTDSTTGSEQTSWWDSTQQADVPSFSELASQSRMKLADREVFIVEQDIVLEDEAALAAYYEETYLEEQEKSIVNKKTDGSRDLRTNPTSMTFCVAGTNWGVQPYWTYKDLNGDGIFQPAAPNNEPKVQRSTQALSATITNLLWGMKAWEGVTNVRFVYSSSLDGTANCKTPGVSFTVTHNVLTCTSASPCNDAKTAWATATGAFPSDAVQAMTIPMSGIDRNLAIHEVGHVLGLRHEHTHSLATPRCVEGGSWEELTGFDTLSAMKYRDCTKDKAILGGEVSILDGIGVRRLYGNPRWWPTVL